MNFNQKNAVITRVKPRRAVTFKGGGIGAWELAGRWSYIDTNGTAGSGPGGQLNDLTVGVNWYLNQLHKSVQLVSEPFRTKIR